MDYISELTQDISIYILHELDLSDLHVVLDLYFNGDKFNIFKLLVIKEFGIIPSRLYEWETVYKLWLKYGRYKIINPITYEDNPDHILETLDIEPRGMELIRFIIYENIAERFDEDFWYSLIIDNVINSSDVNLFAYVISKLKGDLYEKIKDILRFYTRDLWYEEAPISYDMLSKILDYIGTNLAKEFINDTIDCSPSFEAPEYKKLIEFLITYSQLNNIKLS